MIPKIKILFYLLNSKQTAKGTSTIYCRIVMDNLRKQFSTGIDIPSNEWDKLKQKAKGKSIENKTINLHIDQIKNKLTEAETRLMIEKPDNYSIEDIYLIFKGEYEENTPTLLKLFKERLDKMEKLVGSEYTIRTFRKFKEVFKHVKDFLRDSYKISDISFKKLDFKFIQNFQEYLLIQKKHKPITINKIIQRVNQIVLLAVKYKYIQEHPFKVYKPLKEAKQLVFLTD